MLTTRSWGLDQLLLQVVRFAVPISRQNADDKVFDRGPVPRVMFVCRANTGMSVR